MTTQTKTGLIAGAIVAGLAGIVAIIAIIASRGTHPAKAPQLSPRLPLAQGSKARPETSESSPKSDETAFQPPGKPSQPDVNLAPEEATPRALTPPQLEQSQGQDSTPTAQETYRAAFKRGEVAYRDGEFRKAIAAFDETIRLEPKFDLAYVWRASAYKRAGEYEKAIADCTEAIRLNPSNAGAWYNRGSAYSWKKAYDDAIADYNEAIRLDPKNADAWSARGTACFWNKAYEHAIADYDEALKLDPKNYKTWNARGAAYSWQKNYQQAVADYNKAIDLNPTFAEAFLNQGRSYQALGQKANADAAFQKYRELTGSSAVPSPTASTVKEELTLQHGKSAQENDETGRFYSRRATAEGIEIKGPKEVSPRALQRAKAVVKTMLGKSRKDIKERLVASKAAIAIFPDGKLVTVLPEFAPYRDASEVGGIPVQHLYGLGGAMGQPVCGVAEWGVDKGCLHHEFGHSVMNLGFGEEDHIRWKEIFESAKSNSTFGSTYAMRNAREYWAEMSRFYFTVGFAYTPIKELRGRYHFTESKGQADIKRRDPKALAFLREIYGPFTWRP